MIWLPTEINSSSKDWIIIVFYFEIVIKSIMNFNNLSNDPPAQVNGYGLIQIYIGLAAFTSDTWLAWNKAILCGRLWHVLPIVSSNFQVYCDTSVKEYVILSTFFDSLVHSSNLSQDLFTTSLSWIVLIIIFLSKKRIDLECYCTINNS